MRKNPRTIVEARQAPTSGKESEKWQRRMTIPRSSGNIQLATGVTTVAATGLLAASAHAVPLCHRHAVKHSIFSIRRRSLRSRGKMNQGEAKEAEQWFSETKQPVSITSRDGLKLHGWLFDPDCIDPTPHIYAICVHGYTGAPVEQAKCGHTAMPVWVSPSSHYP